MPASVPLPAGSEVFVDLHDGVQAGLGTALLAHDAQGDEVDRLWTS